MTTLRKPVILVLLSVGCIGLLWAAPLPETILEEFPVPTDGDALLVPVSFDGAKHLFLLDTGSEITVCDKLLREKLLSAKNMPLALGKFHIGPGADLQSMDLQRLREVSGHDISGILGMDQLRSFIVQLDLDLGKLRFLRHAGPECGIAMPLERDPQHVPRIVANVSGANGEQFILDTGKVGYGSGALRPELFDALAANGNLQLSKGSFDESLAGKSVQRNGRMAGLTLNEFVLRDLVFARQRENLLGLRYLLRFVATFDFPNRIVYLKKSQHYHEADAQDRSGLHIIQRGESRLVETVDPGSAADLVGILAGDEILRVSEREGAQMTLFAIRTLLCRPEEVMPLTIQRKGQIINFTIKLSM